MITNEKEVEGDKGEEEGDSRSGLRSTSTSTNVGGRRIAPPRSVRARDISFLILRIYMSACTSVLGTFFQVCRERRTR